jgi:hypothetical protein
MEGAVTSFPLTDTLGPFVHGIGDLLKQQSIFSLDLCTFILIEHISFAIIEDSGLVIEGLTCSIRSSVSDSIEMTLEISFFLFLFENFLAVAYASEHNFIIDRLG